jgi:hypothetical protein
MQLVLVPQDGPIVLGQYYERAFSESKELYIVSAYLTAWKPKTQLNAGCQRFRFIVGKDFGITRKEACRSVMKWLPKNRLGEFFVADYIDGFHPKAMFWRDWNDDCFALVGSSNLSTAAFTKNHEANFYSKIDAKTFDEAKKWIDAIESESVIVSEDWLNKYNEALRQPPDRTGKGSSPVVNLVLPISKDRERLQQVLSNRRAQIREFAKSKSALVALMRNAARKKPPSPTDNATFYEELNKLWVFGEGGSRFQGAGWERQGKNSDFSEFSRSFLRVLDSEDSDRDQIDELAEKRVPTRGALFSEMLCQFFPKKYIVLDAPIKDWVKASKFAAPAHATEGVRYFDLALKLRRALSHAANHPAKNLAELDAVIWLDSDEKKKSANTETNATGYWPFIPTPELPAADAH